MALEDRDYAGGAVETTITALISPTALSIPIQVATGWPSGGANGPFHVIIDYDVAGREVVEVASRTGTTLTVADTSKRGVTGTTAAEHQSGAKIRHCFTSQDADEANRAVLNTIGRVTTKGDLIAATGANVFARRAVGSNGLPLVADSAQATGLNYAALTSAGLAADSVGSTQIAADAVGASELANNAVDTAAIANLAVTGAKIANDTITATQIAADAIGTSELADNAVDTNAIANLAVTAGKIANDTITATQIAAGAIGASELANGAVADTADIVDGIITLAKFASEAGTEWGSPGVGTAGPFNNLTIGTGGVTYARHIKLGRLVVMFFGFQLGTGGDLASGALGINLPFNCANITGFSGNDAAVGGFIAVRAFNNSTSARVSGTGVVATTEALNFVAAFTSAVWNFANPFDWSDAGSGSKLQGLGAYLTA